MSVAPALRFERVAAAEVRPLRALVLRPGIAPEKLVYDGDEAADVVHLAARDAEGVVQGIASMYPEPAPDYPDAAAWRLRGMATAPAVRGTGVGGRLLRGCFEHIRAAGGGLLWCNARLVALGFYEHLGLRTEGEEFDIAGIGPHYVMTRWLARLRPARVEDAPALTALALRAKAHWGYSPEFLARCEGELAVTPGLISGGDRHYVVAEVKGALAGFHAVQPQATGDLVLDSLFVEPSWIGRGIGRELFEHAVGIGLKLGAARIVTEADPGAAGFYSRMGAVHEGDVPSPIEAGRSLPRYVLNLPCASVSE